MHDVQRFMRYVLPGSACILQLFVMLLLFHPFLIKRGLEWMARNNLQGGDLGVAAGAFLASGALGYLLACIYFFFFWNLEKRMLPEHKPLLQALNEETRGRFEMRSYEGEPLRNMEEFSKRDALIAVTQFLHWEKTRSKEIKGFLEHSDSLLHLYHGLGAYVVGSFFCLPAYVISVRWFDELSSWDLFALLLWILFLGTLCFSWVKARNKFARLVNNVMFTRIMAQVSNGKKVTMYFDRT